MFPARVERSGVPVGILPRIVSLTCDRFSRFAVSVLKEWFGVVFVIAVLASRCCLSSSLSLVRRVV